MSTFDTDFFTWLSDGQDGTSFTYSPATTDDSFSEDILSNEFIDEMVNSASTSIHSSYFTPSVKNVQDEKGRKYSREEDLAFLLSGKAPDVVTRKGPRGTTRTINTVDLRIKYERSFYAEVFAYIFANQKKVYTDDICIHFNNHLVAQAFGKKRPEKYITKVVANIETWLFFMNCVRPFESTIAQAHTAMTSRKLQRDSKAEFPAMAVIMAMQQAKDNSKLGLMSLPYITRICTMLLVEFDVPVANMSKRLATYAKKDFILHKKGVKGGVATRVAVKPTSLSLSREEKMKVVEFILSSFKESEVKTALSSVLLSLVEQDEITSYQNEEFIIKIETLIRAFKKISKQIGDERVFERHAEENEFIEKQALEAEARDARIKAHLASGLGFQPRRTHNSAVAVMEPETVVEASESAVAELINTTPTPVAVTSNVAQNKPQPFTPEWYTKREEDNLKAFLNDPKLNEIEW